MSETPQGAGPAAANAPGALPQLGEGCPIDAGFLPPNMRKHVDVKAPVPLRGMAAKGLVPLSPSDMCGALFILKFDPDAGIREAAVKTASAFPDRILATALRDEAIKPPVLGWLVELFGAKEQYAEMLILNASTPDESIALLAKTASPKTLEIIGNNQLRILRHEDIIRQLVGNPQASPALITHVTDFAARSGVGLQDVPQMREARIRVFGPQAADKPPDPGPTADEIMEEYKESLKDEAAAPMEEGKRLTLAQRIMKMNISEKIKLATLGNKEARSLLIRDSNKLVSVAVIRSPRITDGEVLAIANNRAANEDVLRVVYSNREWLKSYPLRLALVKNPKCPTGVTMRFLSTLRESEIKDLARNKNIPSGIQMMAKKMMDKKNAPKKDDK